MADVVPEDELTPPAEPVARGNGKPKIPGYRLERVIGRGATGVVWRAVQVAVERPVAVKILRPELVGAKRAIRRLQREARTGARLAHPAIISAIDLGEVGGLWWYAMELVEGVPLSHRLRDGRTLSEREALRLFSPLCDALQHAYESGVVHRDIKPANILIDSHGRARLVDLGLAFAEDDPMLTKSGGTLGTPHYISPEQARDPSSADTRSDIWSLGATMYHALCGAPPFEGESVAEILSGVLYEAVPDPRRLQPGLSKGVSLVLRKCLTRDPARRYQEPLELMYDLERLRERRNPVVREAQLDPVAGSRPAWLVPLVVALVAIIGAGFWAWTRRDWSPSRAADPTEFRARDAQLAFLAERLRGGELSLADGWRGLDEIEPDRDAESTREELRGLVLDDLKEELDHLVAMQEEAFRQALESGDYLVAERHLGAGLERALDERTGFPRFELLPAVLRARYRDWQSSLRVRLDERRERAIEEAQRRLETTFEEELRGRLDRLLVEHRWLEARALLASDAARWFDWAGVDVHGLDEAQRARVLGSIEARRSSSQASLLRDWLALDAELAQWIDEEADELSAELELGHATGEGPNVAEMLDARAHARLSDLGIDEAQIPADWERRSARVLAKRRAELLDQRERVLRDYAARALELSERSSAELCAQRRYREAAELWKLRRDDPAMHDFRASSERRLRECSLLGRVLERAVEGLRALDADRRQTFYLGTIQTEGRVEAPGEALTSGFVLRTAAGEGLRLVLVGPALGGQSLVAAQDVDRLAGLARGRLSDEERLMRALFHFHEGNPRLAKASLPYAEMRDDELVADLYERLMRDVERLDGQQRERRDELDKDLVQIRIAAQNADPARAVALAARVEQVLTEYGDLLGDEDRAELERIAQGLRQIGRPTIESMFQPGSVTERGRQIELAWTFDQSGVGAWRTGQWAWDGVARVQKRALDDRELLDPTQGMRLALGPPLDVGGGLALELDFGLRESAAPNTLFVHLAGYTVGFLDDARDPRFLVASLPELEVLRALDRGEGWRHDGLPWERDFVLRLTEKAGRVGLFVDGEALPLPKSFLKRPTLEPGRAEVRVQSALPVRLLGVRLEGKKE